MPIDLTNSTNNSNNGKTHGMSGNQPTPQSRSRQPQSSHTSEAGGVVDAEQFDADDYLKNLFNKADLAAQAIEKAGYSNAAHFIGRKATEFAQQKDSLKNSLKVLMNPDAPLGAALVELAQEFNSGGALRIDVQLGKHQTVVPPLPELPSFSDWYQQPSQSERLLTSETQTNSQASTPEQTPSSATDSLWNDSSSAPSSGVVGNGKPSKSSLETPTGKGFSSPAKG